MTAGTKRNGSSKFGRFGRSSARPGAPDLQARGSGEIEFDGRDEDSYFAHGGHPAHVPGAAETSPDGLDYGGYDWDAVYDSYAHEVYGADGTDEAYEGHEGDAGDAGDEDPAGHRGDAHGQQKQGRKAERYTGRHASPRGRTARKRRVGMVVPAAAVAATLAAGTAAAYALDSGGHTQAAQLNTAMMRPAAAVATPSASPASAAPSSLVKVAQATASVGTRAAAKPAASRKPSATPSASSATATPSSTPTPSAPATTQAATPAATASQPTAAASTLSCDTNYSMLPENVTAIVSFLLANGYSDNAAAGIAGNIYQESGGDPESIGTGGGGLIGWTPLPSGFVTGDVSADLQYQLSQILVYNQEWSSYIPALNAAATPSDAAYIYVTDFERAGIPATANREESAENVAEACGI